MATHANFDKDTEARAVVEAFATQVQHRVVLITGVNSKGLGGETARALATQAPKLLILTGRGPEKVREVEAEIKAVNPAVSTRFLQIDLASPASVRKAAAEVNSYPENIDIVINNAGAMALPRRTLTAQGVELQFASNHVGHFLLTNLIMPKLLAAAASGPKGATRVVNVSSFGHNISPIRFSDPTFAKRTSALPESERKSAVLREALNMDDPEGADPAELGYDAFAAYGQSKTANVLFSLSINQKLGSRGIRSFSLHPGSIWTELPRHVDEEYTAKLRSMANMPRKSLSAGASTQLVAALDPGLKADGKDIYLDDCQLGKPHAWAVDPEAAEKLWEMSETIVGQEFKY